MQLVVLAVRVAGQVEAEAPHRLRGKDLVEVLLEDMLCVRPMERLPLTASQSLQLTEMRLLFHFWVVQAVEVVLITADLAHLAVVVAVVQF